ncbi:hypothetical protein FBQ97_22030, partial [Acidobacteria bacterium ACD]|nr:hypothetical protein [Acidobacteria bacterium ACD]
PWTLPGNVALTVGEKIDYLLIEGRVDAESPVERLYVAKARFEAIVLPQVKDGGGYEVVAEMKGRDLLGKHYEPLYSYLPVDRDEVVAVVVVMDQQHLAWREHEMLGLLVVMAQRMVESKATSAHVTTIFEVDYTNVARLRDRVKDRFYAQHGTKLSFLPFLFRSVIAGLKARPLVNASVSGEDVVYHREVNLGMAVALDWGLIVPVIKGADNLSLVGLARAANDLAARARAKKLLPDEVQGGTFTITNPGVYGSLIGTPIINQPQVAILSVGTIEKRPKVVELPDGSDAIAIKTMGYLSLTFDHRLIDGAEADAFMNVVKSTLEASDFRSEVE